MKRETVEEVLKRGGVIKQCPDGKRIEHHSFRDDTAVWNLLDSGAVSLAGEPLHTFPRRKSGVLAD